MIHRRRRLLYILLWWVVAQPGAWAATYYTATNGNNANSCTQAQNSATPKADILNGILCLTANNGDTLIIKDGVYAESILNYAPAGTSWAAPTTIKAQNPRQAILRPSGQSFVVQVTGSAKHYIVFDGLVLDGINGVFNSVKIDGNTSLGFPDHIRFTNCEVMNAANGSGFLITTDGAATAKGGFNELLNNSIHDNGHQQAIDTGTGNTSNLYIQNADNLVQGNDIYRSWGVGITNNKQNAGFPDRNIYRNNKIHDNGLFGNKGTGLVLTSNADLQIYNNLIYNNTGTFAYGIDTDVNFTVTSKIENNTIYGNTGVGINIGSNSSNNFVRNNIVYSNGSTIGNSGAGNTLSNNLTTNPLFVDAANGNFQLQAGSTAINQGVTATEVTTDFAGVVRPQGVAYDIGAYEFAGSTDIVPPSPPTNVTIQ